MVYVALLRGINVGGHKLIKMKELARIFTDNGLKNVRTYIASGNVIFESGSANKAALTRKIEKALQQTLGYEVTVVLRTLSEIESIVNRNPFKRYEASKECDAVPGLSGERTGNQTEFASGFTYRQPRSL